MILSEYPSEYHAMFAQALEADVELVFSTRRAAKNFRTDLYRFRTAARNIALDTKAQSDKDYYLSLRLVKVFIREELDDDYNKVYKLCLCRKKSNTIKVYNEQLSNS